MVMVLMPMEIMYCGRPHSQKQARLHPIPAKRNHRVCLGKVVYPFDGYGWDSLPQAETILIKNGTVWTNEKRRLSLKIPMY